MPADAALAELFPGDGAVSALMRGQDWASTPLGPAEGWPSELTIPLRMMLSSRFEMWLGWGPDLHFFYNDAYVPTLGIKHPTALGTPMQQVWREVFAAVEDRIVSVMRDGVATWDDSLMLLLERSGYPEETYHTFSYSPLRGPSGGIEGLMCVVTEVTEAVIGQRRLDTLRTLAANLLGVRTREQLREALQGALAANPRDFPFAFLLPLENPEQPAGLGRAPWPLEHIRSRAEPFRAPLQGPLAAPPPGVGPNGAWPSGAWAIPPREALIAPIRKTGQETSSGALVLGLNPHRPDDPGIEDFAALLAGQVAGVLATVDARLTEAAEARRLKDLFAQSPSFMAILRGPEHRFEVVNPAYREMVGGRDLEGLTVREALPEVGDSGLFEVLDRVLASGEPFVATALPIPLRRGPESAVQIRFLDFVYQPIRGGDGLVSGIFVEGIDVTDAHDSAIALRESDALFGAFAQTIPNQLWTAKPDGNLDWLNDRIPDYSGRPAAELIEAGWVDIVHPDDRGRAGVAWAHSLATGVTYDIEFRIRRADGVYRWHLVRAVPMHDDDGSVIRWIGTNTDIEERRQSEAAFAAERQRIWSMTNDLMAGCGLDGFLKSVNPAWTRRLGYSAGELLGRPFISFIAPDDQSATREVGRRLSEGRAVPEFTNQLVHKDGRRSFVSWSAEPAEELFYIVGRDITEQRNAEDALRQSQKMEAVGQLTGGIAHDFNNLLQGITGSLDLVQKRLSQGRTGELDRFISGAMTSANRASALTHRLLAFSRRQPLDPRPVRANPLMASMEDLLRRTLGERITLELVLSGGLWLTLCDPNQLENAVLNLAINARDAMPEGGKLTLETCNAHLDSAYAAQARDVAPGQYVCLCVTDTGGGMSAETIARAFEPFFTTKPIGQGTGLGLSMIYGFARQSEGYAKIYSEIGRGTTVKLYLPRHRGDTQDEEPGPPMHEAHGADAGEIVLVVEDEPVVRGLIVEVLTDLGYHALEAADGNAGLEILQSKRRIDLLITDMGLPGLNGRQIADAGRTLRPGLKVLFMTGYAENAALASGFLEPGMAMITKPFAMEVLAGRIRQIIEDA